MEQQPPVSATQQQNEIQQQPQAHSGAPLMPQGVPMPMGSHLPGVPQMPGQAESAPIPPEQMHYNMIQQQQMYMMQQYMYPGNQGSYPQYQNQWNQYQQYQQYQQQMYEQQQHALPRQQQAQEPNVAEPQGKETTPPAMTTEKAEAVEPPKKNAWGVAPKANEGQAQKEEVEESMQKLNLKDEAAGEKAEANGKVEDAGSKSWADIARDKNAQAEDAETTQTLAESSTDGDREKDRSATAHSYKGGRGGFKGRGGKHHGQNNRQRLAGRRGLTLQELQGQVHQLLTAQRLVTSANQMRVDPSFLYHTQMSQYAAYYGSYVPMPFTTPGSVALDDNSYPFLQLLSLYPHLVAINQTTVMPNPAHAKFFVFTCKTELEAHVGIKYSRWDFPNEYAAQVNQALGEVSGLGSVYVFFVVPTYKRCVGLAEIASSAGPTGVSANEDGQEEEAEGTTGETQANGNKQEGEMARVLLRWLCVKDTHLGIYRRAGMLEDKSHVNTEENKSSDEIQLKEKHSIYVLENTQGLQGLQIMLEQPVVSTILLDFKMFDDAEASGTMPSYYRSDFFLPGYSYNSRGRGGYSRGSRGGRGNYSGRSRGGFQGNSSFRGGYRRGRGRGRGGYRNSDDGDSRPRYSGNRQHDSNSGEQNYRERPRRLVAGDGAEVSLDGRYQFEIQRKVKKGKKGKKESAGEEAKTEETAVTEE